MNDTNGFVESDDIAALRWEALTNFGHDEIVNQLLGLPDACEVEKLDRREAFDEILRALKILCGSDDAAIRWLFNNSFFSAAAGSDPYYSLENREFWPMQVMLDWLKVFVRIQEEKLGSFPELFPGK